MQGDAKVQQKSPPPLLPQPSGWLQWQDSIPSAPAANWMIAPISR